MTTRPTLPVDASVDQLVASLDQTPIAVLRAPPGTGKTTRVPPALLGARWLGDRRIVVLEPRRVAARAAATRIAAELGEPLGATIGLRTRFETAVGSETRIEIVTEGVLTQMLLADPSLAEVGAVLFDEFHERSIHADTALAFCRETASVLRPDLRLVLMSATLDAAAVAARLGDVPVITTDAPLHPVDTIYVPPEPGRSAEDAVPHAVSNALAAQPGDILVFLAGAADIRRAHRLLAARLSSDDVAITPLHGGLPPREQDRALRPDPGGRRKVILSTPLAETSVTINGVRAVVDTGRRRRPEIDVGRGMSALRTVQASRAATDQRRGRAGREAPGICIRLWTESEQRLRRADEPPEILTADLTQLALQLAVWGVTEADELPWLDAPPEPSLSAARGVLTALGIIDDHRRLTGHGRNVAALRVEPRLGHLMVRGAELGHAATACDVAAVLAEGDLLRGRHRPIDLRLRLDALASPGEPATHGAVDRARELARRWRRRLGAGEQPPNLDVVGQLVSVAFPERIAQRRADGTSYLLASGAGVGIAPDDPLGREPWLAVASTSGLAGDGTIETAAPISREDVEGLHADGIESAVVGGWDRRAREAVFERRDRFGSLILRRETILQPDQKAITEALLTGLRREGLHLLAWTRADVRLRERLQFLHRTFPEAWPSFDDDVLLAGLEHWLAPSLRGARRRADLEHIDVSAALLSTLDWRQTRDVDRLAPSHLEVPSGSRLPIDYAAEGGPALSVRLQEVFGLATTPTVAEGHVPVVLHLLSPAHRPVQVTSDIASFWSEGYPEVRKELRGRYPKHHWPDDPTTATPSRRPGRRG